MSLLDPMDRVNSALEKVARTAGYERAWVAPSGEPNIILERAHPTEPGKIQVTRLDLVVSVQKAGPDGSIRGRMLRDNIVESAMSRRRAEVEREAVLTGMRRDDPSSTVAKYCRTFTEEFAAYKAENDAIDLLLFGKVLPAFAGANVMVSTLSRKRNTEMPT